MFHLSDVKVAIREGDWKLLGNARDNTDRRIEKKIDKLFLANLAQDPSETTNLASQYPEIVERLSKLQVEFNNSILETLEKEQGQ